MKQHSKFVELQDKFVELQADSMAPGHSFLG